MTRIADLCRRVEALEGKRQRALLVKALSTYDADVEQVGKMLSAAESGTAAVERAFGAERATVLRARLRESSQKAGRLAATLAKRIRANEAYVGTNEAGNAVSDLKAVVPATRRIVTEAWAKALSDRCSLLGARLVVAEVAGAPQAAKLRFELDQMATVPFPSIEADLRKVVDFLSRAEKDVGAAGASENLSRFIESAMRGSASAHDLDDIEVRAFLDAHRLWPRLTVKLT